MHLGDAVKQAIAIGEGPNALNQIGGKFAEPALQGSFEGAVKPIHLTFLEDLLVSALSKNSGHGLYLSFSACIRFNRGSDLNQALALVLRPSS